jgi:hypothetical protein
MNSIFFLLIMMCRMSFADTAVYIQSAETSDIEFYAEVKSAQGQTYAQNWLESNKDEKSLYHLKNLFLDAQKKFLKSEAPEQIQMWREIAHLEYKADWPPHYREMIQMAWLRMAQLVKDAKTEESYLLHALSLDSHFNYEVLPLPQSLKNRLHEIKRTLPKVSVSLQNFKGFTHLLVNGSPRNIADEKLELPDGTHRFTWVSNQFHSITRTLDAKGLNEIQLERTPMAEGSCKKPNVTIASDLALKVVYPLECVAEMKPNAADVKKYSQMPASENLFATKLDIEPKPFYKESKFWLGTAIVSGLVLFVQQQNEKDSHQPTHRRGI